MKINPENNHLYGIMLIIQYNSPRIGIPGELSINRWDRHMFFWRIWRTLWFQAVFVADQNPRNKVCKLRIFQGKHGIFFSQFGWILTTSNITWLRSDHDNSLKVGSHHNSLAFWLGKSCTLLIKIWWNPRGVKGKVVSTEDGEFSEPRNWLRIRGLKKNTVANDCSSIPRCDLIYQNIDGFHFQIPLAMGLAKWNDRWQGQLNTPGRI